MISLKTKKLFSRLTKIQKNKPLHKMSLLFILALDVFVIFNIFQGLYFQGSQITKTYEVIPYECKKFIEYQTNFDIVNNAMLYYHGSSKIYFNSKQEIINQSEENKIHKFCKQIYEKSNLVYENEDLQIYLNKISSIKKSQSNLRSQNKKYEENYNTMLLEKIADQDSSESIVVGKANNVKANIKNNNKKIQEYNTEVEKLKIKITDHELSKDLVSTIKYYKDDLNKEYSSLLFWYPLKKILLEMVFLLPLLIVFLWIYIRNLKKENSLYTLVFSHLLVVSFIPVFIKLLELILDILPFGFFRDLLRVLEALNIVALWNYILIFLGIVLVIFMVKIFQKFTPSYEKIRQTRIEKGSCWNCNKKNLKSEEEFCGFCGERKLIKCSRCGKLKHLHAEFCNNCGYKS